MAESGICRGYETVTPSGSSPKSASGTEKSNQGKGPGPDWAKGSAK